MSWGEAREGDFIRVPSPLPVVKETWRQKVSVTVAFSLDARPLPLLHERVHIRLQLCVVGLGALGARDRLDGDERDQHPSRLRGVRFRSPFHCSQEYVIGEVYADMGLTEEESLDHFTGIAFLVDVRRCVHRSRGTAWVISTSGPVR